MTEPVMAATYARGGKGGDQRYVMTTKLAT
jgi:hypothetical protein